MKPMYPEDACVQMELTGHDFFVFRNAETDEVNVVYSSGCALFSMAGESSFRLSTKGSVSQCGEGSYDRWFLRLHLVSYYPAWHIFADKPDNTFPH